MAGRYLISDAYMLHATPKWKYNIFLGKEACYPLKLINTYKFRIKGAWN